MITRDNYEEFFLLYTDNELSVQERHAVERFVAENTDLREELNSLLQCRINPDNHFIFSNKESLLKQESLPAEQSFFLNDENYEACFLNYIDRELNETERKAVEDYTAANPSRLRELQLLQQAVLIPDTTVVFEKKEVLYRREGKGRLLPMPWLRAAAAAAVVLLGIGLYLFNTRNIAPSNTPIAGHLTNKNKAASNPVNGQIAGSGDEQGIKSPATTVTPAVTDTLYHQGQRQEQGRDLDHQNTASNLPGHLTDAGTGSKVPVRGENRTTSGENDRNNHSDGSDLAKVGSGQQKEPPVKVTVKQEVQDEQNNHPLNLIAARDLKVPQENHISVNDSQHAGDGQGSISKENSSFATQALLKSENGSPEDGYASEEPASPKKTKLRGLFRRVSRVFEKTTNVDDEKHGVLIGSFQFALK